MLKLEYIWIGGNGELRSKVKVLQNKSNLMGRKSNSLKTVLKNAPEWNYDGSSTSQATGSDSEVILRPVACFYNPFNNLESSSNCSSYLILCDTYLPEGTPHDTNNRNKALTIFSNEKYNCNNVDPLFGLELEFFVFDSKTNQPLGFTGEGDTTTGAQGPYYCSVGHGNCYGRDFLENCLDNCIKAGLPVTGSNMEVCCGQMEIQICSTGISAGDNNIVLKYILERTGESYGYRIDYSAKPIKGDWNGSGCHVNYSTKKMREENGIAHIMSAIEKLSTKHLEHIAVYGEDNNERLTGLHETSSMEKFTHGVADRGASIRIPRTTQVNQCGYFEDRRPSASADMYLVTSIIYETCSSPLDRILSIDEDTHS